MEAVHYSLTALQLKGQQRNNANYGVNPAFQMEYHAYKYQIVHLISHSKLVQIKEQMEFASGKSNRVNPIKELADYKYAQMQLQILILILDVLNFKQILLVQQQKLVAYLCLHVSPTKLKEDVQEEQMVSVFGNLHQTIRPINHIVD